MLEYERIDISEGIDVNKTNLSKECDICHYWYFKDIGFKYKPYLRNGCHELMKKAMGFNNIAIVYVKESAYRIHFWYMSKHKDIFACLFSIHNIISLSCHEQVCLSGLRFERYFSHHQAEVSLET